MELVVKLIDNGGQRLDTLHVANWSDMNLVHEVIDLRVREILSNVQLEDGVSMLIFTFLVLGQP